MYKVKNKCNVKNKLYTTTSYASIMVNQKEKKSYSKYTTEKEKGTTAFI